MSFEKTDLPSGVSIYTLPLWPFVSVANLFMNSQSRALFMVFRGKLVSRTISLKVTNPWLSSQIALTTKRVFSSVATPLTLKPPDPWGLALFFSELRSFMLKYSKHIRNRMPVKAQVKPRALWSK